MDVKCILSFLKELAKNNRQEWFQENKADFEKAKFEFAEFVSKLILRIGKFDNSVKNLSTKNCIFRIYRDVRFSKDKTPYKTNFGAYIAGKGKNRNKAGYYFHLEPGNYFIGGGIYMPPADVLKRIRNEIYFNTPKFKKLICQKTFKSLFGELYGEKLVNVPKEFPKDHPDGELLKYKSYTLLHSITEKQLLAKDLFEYTIQVYKAMQPFNDFINKALENK